jgi:hypothetical protein
LGRIRLKRPSNPLLAIDNLRNGDSKIGCKFLVWEWPAVTLANGRNQLLEFFLAAYVLHHLVNRFLLLKLLIRLHGEQVPGFQRAAVVPVSPKMIDELVSEHGA